MKLNKYDLIRVIFLAWGFVVPFCLVPLLWFTRDYGSDVIRFFTDSLLLLIMWLLWMFLPWYLFMYTVGPTYYMENDGIYYRKYIKKKKLERINIKTVKKSFLFGNQTYKIDVTNENFPLTITIDGGWFVERDYPDFAKEILKEFPPGRYENGELVEPYPND
ncbi:MAG: hypothetical protein JSW52_07905 [Candidatus Coatesbacteria bacterium]|nr:MAG: hypothetical protein JSW52_07905 [Candidatus Coatesbacteria bacterium]